MMTEMKTGMITQSTSQTPNTSLQGLTGATKVEKINSLIGGAGTIINYLPQYYNLIAKIDGHDPSLTIAITAHHDTVHPEYENCLDNTASVLNLTKIYRQLVRNKPRHNIICAWVDAEEACNLDIAGVTHLVKHNQIEYVIDLELTASGTIPLVKKYGLFNYGSGNFWDNLISKNMPYNNAYAASLSGVIRGSACLTIVSEKDLNDLDHMHFCDRWRQCHSITDTFDTWYSESESGTFINNLISGLL